MAFFTKKKWVDRQSEYPNRRILNPTGTANEYEIIRSEGTVMTEGDKLNAENLNNLEERVAAGLQAVETALCGCIIKFEDEEGNPTDEPYVHWDEPD